MATENNKNSQRNIRYTIRLNEEENALIRHDALTVKNYSNKAVARYIRDELLSSVSKADNGPSIVVPSINEELANQLEGAVRNLNQAMKQLNRIAHTSTISSQIQQAEEIQKHAIETSELCKQLRDFSKGNVKNNINLLANIVVDSFDEETFRKLVGFYKKKKGIK